MTRESDVGKELLRQDAPAPGTGKDIVDRTVRRERGRLRLWAAATVALWVAVAGYCVLSTYLFLMFFYPILADRALSQGAHGKNREVVAALADYLLISNIIWPTLLLAAALLTVAFILKSRRATLRQIQAELAGISDQIRTLSRKD